MKPKKRQELPKPRGQGTLYVVATPIGNLEDLSPRARRTFGEVDGILCEDTRMTAKLLNAAAVTRANGQSFEGCLERLDHHADHSQLERVVARLTSGEKLALVSDAGTPAISDPGAELVALAAEGGIEVIVIPGPSALTTFLAGAGFTAGSPIFRGFFPRKVGDRKAECERVLGTPFPAVFVWFESPERVEDAVEFLAGQFPDLLAVVAKEMTKLHEKFIHGTLADLTSHIQSARAAGEIRGEWVIGVSAPGREESTAELNTSEWKKAVTCLLNSGISASRAAREISHVFGIPRNEVYPVAMELAKSLELNGSAVDAVNKRDDDDPQ